MSGRRLSREGTGCCGTGGCCVANPGASEALGCTAEQLADAPEGANLGLGCGNLQAIARLTTGGDAGNCCSPNEASVRIRARTP